MVQVAISAVGCSSALMVRDDRSAAAPPTRAKPNPCAACGHEVRVMLRAKDALYLRCERCGVM
jgi:predicted nucleic acid-binding Zn ribbon protein